MSELSQQQAPRPIENKNRLKKYATRLSLLMLAACTALAPDSKAGNANQLATPGTTPDAPKPDTTLVVNNGPMNETPGDVITVSPENTATVETPAPTMEAPQKTFPETFSLQIGGEEQVIASGLEGMNSLTFAIDTLKPGEKLTLRGKDADDKDLLVVEISPDPENIGMVELVVSSVEKGFLHYITSADIPDNQKIIKLVVKDQGAKYGDQLSIFSREQQGDSPSVKGITEIPKEMKKYARKMTALFQDFDQGEKPQHPFTLQLLELD